jgi:hypothetical protein
MRWLVFSYYIGVTKPVQNAYEADEIFICTTAGGIMQITSLDGKLINDQRWRGWSDCEEDLGWILGYPLR